MARLRNPSENRAPTSAIAGPARQTAWSMEIFAAARLANGAPYPAVRQEFSNADMRGFLARGLSAFTTTSGVMTVRLQ